MTDGIIKGTGNSRFLKSVADIMTRYPTWDAAAAALAAGTFPIDLNGINELGWQTLGTLMVKANLLSDAAAGRYGLPGSATLNDVFLHGIKQVEKGSYVGAGDNDNRTKVTLTFSVLPSFIFIMGKYEMKTFPDYAVAFVCVAEGAAIVFSRNSGNTGYLSFSVEKLGNVVSWNGRSFEMNGAGHTYYYAAI